MKFEITNTNTLTMILGCYLNQQRYLNKIVTAQDVVDAIEYGIKNNLKFGLKMVSRLCDSDYCSYEIIESARLIPNSLMVTDPMNSKSQQPTTEKINKILDTSEEPTTRPFQVEVADKLVALYNSATKRNIEFSLTYTDVAKILRSKKCYYTGMPIQRYSGSTTPVHRDNMLTVDRIDNTKGYIKGNVVACSHFANNLKEHLFEKQATMFEGKGEYIINMITVIKQLAEENKLCIK